MESVISAKDRQTDLDIAKGIGIILVVWAHAKGPFSDYISGFHMPFFFFISGMLYCNKDRSIKDYTVRKCKSLLAPFWWWNLIFFPVFFVLYYWKNWDPMIAFKGIGEIILTLNKVPFLGTTWFLPALFWVSILVHIFISYLGKKKFCDCLLLIVGVLIAVLGFQITFPYKISRTLICALFYISGYLYQKHIRYRIPYIITCFISIACILAYIFCVKINTFSMGDNVYSYKIVFVVGAFLATYFTLWISETLCKFEKKSIAIKHIIFLGKNSIDLVIWQFMAFRITILLQIVFMGADTSSLTAFPVYDSSGLWWFSYLLSGIYGSLVWKYILEHNIFSRHLRRLCMIR